MRKGADSALSDRGPAHEEERTVPVRQCRRDNQTQLGFSHGGKSKEKVLKFVTENSRSVHEVGPTGRSGSISEQLAEDVRQNTTVFIVTDLLGSVDPDSDGETERRSAASIDGNRQLRSSAEVTGHSLG
jgi:hypothetical protein